jgi:uncharacterized membrane-anchored protein YitT (DUF2179 family)
MVCVVNILITFIVFWAMLSSLVGMDYLMTFENLAVHTFTPLLCLLDYILFTRGRHLKYRDTWYVCIFPVFYAIFSAIASLAGYVYDHSDILGDTVNAAEYVPVRAPYFFLNFYEIGAMVFLYTAVMLATILLLSHSMYFVDQKVRKPQIPDKITT